MTLLASFLNRRLVLWIVFAFSGALGVVLYPTLPVKLYPNTRKPKVNVHIPHPSINASDMYDSFGDDFERYLRNLEGAENVNIEYGTGATDIEVEFPWGANTANAENLVSNAMGQIRHLLPEESEDYSVRAWGGHSGGFLSIACTSSEWDAKQLYQTLQPVLKPHLANLKQAASAQLSAAEDTDLRIELDPYRLAQYQIDAESVLQALRQSRKDLAIGSLGRGPSGFHAKVSTAATTLEALPNVVVRNIEGHTLRLRDIGRVKHSSDLPSRLFRVNGKQAIVLFALPEEDGNIRELAHSIRTMLNNVKKSLPDHVAFQFLVDPGEYIDKAAANVVNNGLLGAGLAIIMTWLILGEWRNTIIIALSIPLSMLISIIGMWASGISVNLISLGGLSLAVGMVVDAAIVVTENIHRHVMEGKEKNLVAQIVSATEEVFAPIISSTLTSVVVFLPLVFTEQLTSAILGDLARTVMFSLSASAIVSLFFVPTVAAVVVRPARGYPSQGLIDKARNLRWIDRISVFYGRSQGIILGSAPKKLAACLVPTMLLAAACIFLLPRLSREVIAKPDSPKISIRFNHSESRDATELFKLSLPLEQKIQETYKDDLLHIFTRIPQPQSGSMTLTLKDSHRRTAVIRQLEQEYPSEGPWRITISRWDPAELPLPRLDDFRVSMQGDMEILKALEFLQKGQVLLRKAGFFADVRTEPISETLRQLHLVPRQSAINDAAPLGLERLARVGQLLLGETKVMDLPFRGENVPVYLRFPAAFQEQPSHLANFLVPTLLGPLPLRHFFNFTSSLETQEIQSENGTLVYRWLGRLKETTPRWQRQQIEQQAYQLLRDNLRMPEGVTLRVDDTQAPIRSEGQSLIVALAASVMLIFMVLTIQFNSLLVPLLLLCPLPLGFLGVVGGLWLTDTSLNLNSMLGTILLGGIAVNNSILLYDVFQRRLDSGEPSVMAMVQACQQRLPAIVITVGTTLLGMLPLAFALGEGTNVLQPLGIAVVFGLGVSTLGTLIVFPCLISFFSHRLTPR